MKRNQKHWLALVCLTLTCYNLVGQTTDTTQSEEFSFVTKYKPVLAESKRMEETPKITKEKAEKPTFSYSIVPIQYQTNKIVHTLPPVNHKFRIKDSVNSNYVKFGMGNINGLLGELYLGNKKSEKYGYGVYWNHLSTKERKTIQAWGENKALLFGNVYGKKINYGASFAYDRVKNYYYGYNTDSIVNTSEEEFKNFANAYQLKAYVSSVKPNKNGIKSRTNLLFHYFDNNATMKETHYALGTNLHKKFMKTIEGGADINFTYTENDNGRDTLDILKRRMNINLRPYVSKTMGASTFTGALNAVVSNANKEDFKLLIFPEFYFKNLLIKDQLTAFASITGGVKAYTYKERFGMNPFIDESSYLNNEITAWKVSGGLDGKIGPKSNFKIELGIKKMTNLLLHANIGDSLNRFSPISDNARVQFVKANINYSVFKKVRFGLAVDFNNYELEFYDDAIGLPTLVLDVYGQYKLGNKIMAKVNLVTVGTREQFNFNEGESVTLNSYTDLNAGLEYFYKSFSVFVQANNILGTSYERYYNYDSYGFNIMGGLSARF